MKLKTKTTGEAARLAWAKAQCRKHARSGRAYIRWEGRQRWLGCAFGDPNMAALALREIDLAEAGHDARRRRSAITVADLIDWIEQRAALDDRKRATFGRLRRLFGETLAADFGRGEFKALRASLVRLSPSQEKFTEWEALPDAKKATKDKPRKGRALSRNSVNHYASAVVWLFREAASEDLITGDVWRALADVRPLRPGKTTAHEGEGVEPVADDIIDAALPHISPVAADIVRVLRFTGARPGEICQMRAGEIDTSGDVWLYRPSEHKTAHHGKDRTIALPPAAQEIVRRHMTTDLAAPIFRTVEGHLDKRGGPYNASSLRRAIHRGCDAAGVARFAPNQIRHTVATELLRAGFRWSEVAAVCGHSQVRTTLKYAKPDTVATAERVATVIGAARVSA